MMASRKSDTKKPVSDRPDERKMRKCLMCSKEFLSEHKGQRICHACRGTAAWREGGYAA